MPNIIIIEPHGHQRGEIQAMRILSAGVNERSATGMAMREIGIVKWFDSSEGSGYIARKKGEDVFVHHSAVRRGPALCLLKEGAAVEFTVLEDKDGLRAHDVVVL